MAILKKKPQLRDAAGSPIDPEGLYSSIESFCWGPDGLGSVQVGFGDLLRGDDATVRHVPAYFLPVGVPTAELREARNRLRFPDERPQPSEDGYPITLAKPLRDEDAVRCIKAVRWQQAFRGGQAGIGATRSMTTVPVGSRLDRNHPCVQANPDSFEPW